MIQNENFQVIEVIRDNKIFKIQRDGKLYYLKRYNLRDSKYGNIKEVLKNIQSANKAPNVIKIHEIKEKNQYLEVIEEYCQGNTLRQNTKDHHILKILLDIINGLLQLKSLNIMHRDIKPDNIVYSEPNFKIIDFETAKIIDQQNDTPIRQSIDIGSKNYRAPQFIQQQEYSSKCDIWSLGCVFYFLLFGKDIDFESQMNRQQEIQQEVITNLIPAISQQEQRYIKLLQEMLQINEQKRPTLEQLHQLVEGLNNDFNNASASTQIPTNEQINIIQDNNDRRGFNLDNFNQIMIKLIYGEKDPQTEINLHKFWIHYLELNQIDKEQQKIIQYLLLIKIKEFQERQFRIREFDDIQQIKQQLQNVVELSEYLR